MSLRLKLIIVFLAIALIPLIFVSTLTFHNYKKSLEATCLSNLQNTAAFKADKVEAYFDGLKDDIKMAQGFYNIKKNLPILIRFADNPNNPEFVSARNTLEDQLQKMQSVSDMSDIMLINPKGTIVYANISGHYFKDMSTGLDAERKAFTEGKDRIYFSDAYYDKVEDNRFEMLVAAPVSDFNGVFIGVIAFEVNMTSLYKIIEDVTGLGKTGEVLVGKRTGNQVMYLNPPRHEPQAVLQNRITIGQKAGVPIQKAVQGRTGAGVSIDYRGKNVIAAWRYIPSLDWGLVAKIDTDEAFIEVIKLRNLALIILAIVIVLSSIIAFSIAQSISKPLKKLAEGAAIIGQGNLDYKIGTHQNDEIGHLSRSFDKMTLALKQTTASRDELNREIADRKRIEDALKFLVQCGEPTSGEDFFQSLARYLGESLGMDFVCIDQLEENLLTARTVAVYSDGKFEDNVSYTLKDTPCGDVVGKTICCFAKDVRHLFPKDTVLETLAAESYLGTTLWSSVGQPIGLIALIGRKPLADTTLAASILQLAAIRTAGEMERRQAEEAVLVSEVRYRRLFEAARDGILILNADSGQIVDVNPFIEEMLGYSHKDLLSKKLWEIGLFKNVAASKESFLELQNKGYVRYENMPLETKDGRRIAVEFVSNVYQVDHQKVIQCNIRDITIRIQAEEALRKSRDELEIRVKDRTKELAQTIDTLQTEIANRIGAENKILVYQKRLRSLATEIVLIEEKERRAIAAALHDSLGPLLAFSKRELGIIRKSAPQELTESLAYVHDKIKQAVDQTRNLTFDLSPATLYTLGLEHALEELVEHFAQDGGFQGNCHIREPIEPLAENIRILLYRSVRELMVNIVKHAGAKNVIITLAKNGNDIQVKVEDDGVGFDISNMDLKTGKLKGFGLFNIYERLIQTGGNLNIQSRENGGTTVVLQLPLINKKD